MTTPTFSTRGEQQATDKLKRRLVDLQGASRKPLALTATLRRRALKNKAAATSPAGALHRASRL